MVGLINSPTKELNLNYGSVLAAALALAKAGLAVLPVRDDKVPTLKEWPTRASNDAEVVKALWRRCPGPLIGVATGKPSGVDVLDLDPRHGGDAWLHQNAPRMVSTFGYDTRSGGLHFYFRHAPDIGSGSLGKVAPGVDVLSTGRFAIAWFAAGFKSYGPLDEIADWPDWLFDLAMGAHGPRPTGARRGPHAASDYQIEKLIRDVGLASEGTRNDTLFRCACEMRRMVGNGLTLDDALEYLRRAAEHAGLSDREVAQTIASAFTTVEREDGHD